MTAGSRRAQLVTAATLAGVIVGMAGLTAASVPLYRLFCQVTGFGGTTQVASEAVPDGALEQTIKVRFDAGIGDDLPWQFRPVQREVEVKIGEENLAFYHAVNTSDQAIVGSATLTIVPSMTVMKMAKM